MKRTIRCLAVLSAFLCTRAVADEVCWTNVNSGQQDWAAVANWQGATDYPSGAVDAAILPEEPVAIGNGSAVQTVRLPNATAFSIGSVSGTWLHRIATYDRTGASVTPRAVTVGDTSGFDGVWMGNALKWSLLLSGVASSPRLSAIDAANRPTVNVPTGVSATLDAVTGTSGYLVKEGAGSLLVRGALNADAQRIDVNAGVLELEGVPDVSDAPGGDPVFWVDAARTNRMDLAEGADGRMYVATWRDARDGHESIVATAFGGADGVYRPFLSFEALGGLPVVDFGAYGWDSTYPADSSLGPSGGMTYDLGEKVRNVILVFADTQVARAFPVGQTSAYQFHRGANNAVACDWTDAKVRNGILRLDGAEAEYGQTVPFGRFHILEYVLTDEGLKPSTFALDRDSRIGGVRLAEAIFYTNRLTHAERATTLRYLRRKWGDSGHMTGSDVNVLATSDETVAVSVPDGRTAKVRQLAVGGTKFVKKGDGTLKVGRFQPESPSLEIHGGAVAFDEKATAVASDGPAEGAIFWGDATVNDSIVSENGAIVAWKDCRADVSARAEVQVGHPTLVENAVNGRRVLDFGTGPGGKGGTASWMKVMNLAGGDYPVREAVQVVRITNDTNYRPNLFGCQSQVLNREAKDVSRLLHLSYAYGKAAAGIWTMDGEAVDPLARFDIDTNAYYIASFSSADAVSAHWLATDRGYEYGDTQLGEVLLYDRVLSDTERQRTIAYLMKKWKGVDAPFAQSPAKIRRMEFSKDNAQPKLVADADTTIGEVVLSAGGTLTKTGTGKVTVETPVRGGVTALDVAGGTLELAGGLTPAAFDSAAFHLDASRKSSFVWREGQARDGRIARWYDCRDNGKYAATPFIAAGDNSYRGGLTNAQYVVSDGSEGLSAGLPYVDFGIHQNNLDNAGSSGMYLYEAAGTRAQVSVREFHAVFRFSGENSTPLGGDVYPRTSALVPNGKDFGGYYAGCTTAISAPKMSDGSAWYTANAYRPDGADATTSFIVYSIAFPEAVDAWNIAIDRNCGVGGLKLCELVIYTDGTNDTATATAINRHLLKKWKGLGDGGDFGTRLPLAVADGASLRIGGATRRFSVPTLTGGGSIDVGDVEGLARLDVSLTADSSLSPVRVKGRVTLADTVTLTVDIRSKKRPAPGTYLLFEADELANAESVNWVCETTGAWQNAARVYTFRRDGNKVYLKVQKKGFVFHVR